jgi:hypothetical protein
MSPHPAAERESAAGTAAKRTVPMRRFVCGFPLSPGPVSDPTVEPRRGKPRCPTLAGICRRSGPPPQHLGPANALWARLRAGSPEANPGGAATSPRRSSLQRHVTKAASSSRSI